MRPGDVEPLSGALAASYYRGQYFLYLVKTHEVIFYGFKMHICGVDPRCGGRGLVLADADNVEIRNVNDISRNNTRVFESAYEHNT